MYSVHNTSKISLGNNWSGNVDNISVAILKMRKERKLTIRAIAKVLEMLDTTIRNVMKNKESTKVLTGWPRKTTTVDDCDSCKEQKTKSTVIDITNNLQKVFKACMAWDH